MKIKSLFIAGCLVIASSCSDFLDHPITDAVSDDNIGEIVADIRPCWENSWQMRTDLQDILTCMEDNSKTPSRQWPMKST